MPGIGLSHADAGLAHAPGHTRSHVLGRPRRVPKAQALLTEMVISVEVGRPLSKYVAFAIGLLFTSTMGGGLIMGVAPFQDALVKQYGYTNEQAGVVFGTAFQILAVGTAVLAPALDRFGPRILTVFGLLMEMCGHHLIAQIESYTDKDTGVMYLVAGYGLVGLGGNLVFMCSIPFSELFENVGVASSIICSGFQAAGFVLMLLMVVPFVSFFRFYRALSLASAAVAFFVYPDRLFDHHEDEPMWGVRPDSLCDRAAGESPSPKWKVTDAMGRYFHSLRELRTWLFMANFAWAGTCATWGLGAFYIIAQEKANVVGGKDAQGMLATLAALQPLLTNATFVFSPFIGSLIDFAGFSIPAIVMGTATCGFCVMVWLLPLALQWMSLLALNLLQALVYTLQVAYIATTYEHEQMGKLMSLTTLFQSLVNPVGVFLMSFEVKQAVLVFMSPMVPICIAWGWHQAMLRKSGKETV